MRPERYVPSRILGIISSKGTTSISTSPQASLSPQYALVFRPGTAILLDCASPIDTPGLQTIIGP